MSRKKIFLISVLAILTMTGFVMGSVVNAAVGSPGSQGDPLVTKSYIDNEVSKLQKQIDTLKEEVNKLKSK